MRTNIFSIFVMAIMAVMLVSCGSGTSPTGESEGDSTGVTDTEIVVGSFGPLTGPAALWGNIMKGMDAYFKMINEEGGINGRTVKFVMKDDAYDPSRTVPAVREMVQRDEVFAFVGGIGTAPCMSVMNYITENNIPWISPISGATHWSIPLNPQIFSVLPYYIDEGAIQARYAINELQSDKIGIIYQNDDVGKSALVGARHILQENGLDFVAEVPVEPTDTDLSSHIARLKSSGADVVLLWTLPRQGAITVSNSQVINYTPQFIASFILSDMGLMHNLTKGAWEGVIFGTFARPPFNLEDATIAKYKDAMAKYYPDVRWGIFPYGGFLYARPFTEALASIEGTVTREKLLDAMNKLDFEFDNSRFQYSPDNHQAFRSMQMLKCTGPESFEELSGLIEADVDLMPLIEELEAL